MAICHFRLHRAKRQPQFLRWVVCRKTDNQLGEIVAQDLSLDQAESYLAAGRFAGHSGGGDDGRRGVTFTAPLAAGRWLAGVSSTERVGG